MFATLLKVLAVIGLGTTKFAFSFPAAAKSGLHWGLAAPLILVSAWFSVWFFEMSSEWIIAWYNRKFNRRKKVPSFSKLRKRIVFWQKYGMWGLAGIGPLFFSIPVTVFLAVRFGATRREIYLTLGSSLLVYTVILTTLSYFFKDLHLPYLPQ